MKIRITLTVAAVLSLALAAIAVAAQTEYKVTGGGQTLASAESNSVKGPGDTVTFQAFIEEAGEPQSAATGHVNIVDRTEGAGGKGVHFRGDVDCAFIVPESADGRGYAELFGTGTTKDGEETPFVVRIQDNGQGSAAETDLVEFDTDTNETCGENDDEEEIDTFLARGNAKIHKANPSQSSRSAKTTSGSSLASALTR